MGVTGSNQTDRQTGRETDRQADGQSDRQSDRYNTVDISVKFNADKDIPPQTHCFSIYYT